MSYVTHGGPLRQRHCQPKSFAQTYCAWLLRPIPTAGVPAACCLTAAYAVKSKAANQFIWLLDRNG